MTLIYNGGINALAFLNGPVEIIAELDEGATDPAWRAWMVRPAGRGNADPRPNRWRAQANQLSVE